MVTTQMSNKVMMMMMMMMVSWIPNIVTTWISNMVMMTIMVSWIQGYPAWGCNNNKPNPIQLTTMPATPPTYPLPQTSTATTQPNFMQIHPKVQIMQVHDTGNMMSTDHHAGQYHTYHIPTIYPDA